MMNTYRSLFAAASSLAFGLTACVGTHVPSALTVEASIASVTLADDCPPAAARPEADCEPGLVGGCGFCQQSSIQLHLTAGAEGTEVPFELVSIRVFDADGAPVALTVRNPREFALGEYRVWDERIAPSDDLSVTYDTSSLDGSLAAFYDPSGRLALLHVVVVVRIDGVDRTLEADASREPEIAT